MSDEALWQVVRYLHVVAMAFFVGGQLVVAVAVLPVERAAADRERLRAIARRFGLGSLIALAVLAATGSAMAAHQHLWGLGTLQLKLGLVGTVVALTGLHLVWPRAHVLAALILAVSLTIVWLGLEIAH